MQKFVSLLLLSCAWCLSLAHADTQIKVMTDENTISQVRANETLIRIDNQSDPEFIIFDLEKQSTYLVLPDEKKILNMSKLVSSEKVDSKKKKIEIHFSDRGKGPDIAGYSTIKYSYSVNGQDCGTIYGSKTAFAEPAVTRIFTALHDITENQLQMYNGTTPMMSTCERGDAQIASHFGTIGLPLKTLDVDSKLTSEVLTIEQALKISPETFSLPEGFQLVSLQEELNQAQEENWPHYQQNGMNMDSMMKQMPHSTQLPAETMQHMPPMHGGM